MKEMKNVKFVLICQTLILYLGLIAARIYFGPYICQIKVRTIRRFKETRVDMWYKRVLNKYFIKYFLNFLYSMLKFSLLKRSYPTIFATIFILVSFANIRELRYLIDNVSNFLS